MFDRILNYISSISILSSSIIASIPGNVLFAIYSKVAPPPLEMLGNIFLNPKVFTEATVSPPPIITCSFFSFK